MKLVKLVTLSFTIAFTFACTDDTSPDVLLDVNGLKVYSIDANVTKITDYSQNGLLAVYSYIPESYTYQAKQNVKSVIERPTIHTVSKVSPNDILLDNNSAYNDIATNNRLSIFNDFRQQEYKLLNQRANEMQQGVQMNISHNIAPKVFNVGDTWNNVYVVVESPVKLINTEVVYVSDNVYFMQEVGNGLPILTQAQLEAYATEFESKYQFMIDTFSTPSDVDSNGKIIVMFTKFSSENLLGYFYPADKTSKLNYQTSNEADIFYINLDWAIDDTRRNTILGTLVHELQHMLLFDKRLNNGVAYDNDLWLNEGLSMLSELINGYNVSGDIYGFLVNSSNMSLINWNQQVVSHYGYSLVFLAYLYDRFGGKDFIHNIYNSTSSGVEAIESVTGLSFNDIFKDFIVASGAATQIPRNAITDKRFKISSIDLSASYYGIRGLAQLTAEYHHTTLTVEMMPYSLVPVMWRGKVTSIKADRAVGIAVPSN